MACVSARLGPSCSRRTISSSRSPTPMPCSAETSNSGSKPELVELHRRLARFAHVYLVDHGEDRRFPIARSCATISRSPGTRPCWPSRTSTSRSACVIACLPFLDDELMQRIFGRAEHAARVEQRKSVPRHVTACSITSRVVPGTGVTIARRVDVIRLNSVDLPTLGRPTSTTSGARASATMYGDCRRRDRRHLATNCRQITWTQVVDNRRYGHRRLARFDTVSDSLYDT